MNENNEKWLFNKNTFLLIFCTILSYIVIKATNTALRGKNVKLKQPKAYGKLAWNIFLRHMHFFPHFKCAWACFRALQMDRFHTLKTEFIIGFSLQMWSERGSSFTVGSVYWLIFQKGLMLTTWWLCFLP